MRPRRALTGPIRLPALVLSSALLFSGLPGFAQNTDQMTILDLTPTVRDLSASVLDIKGTSTDLSATAQDLSGVTQDLSAEVKETLGRSGDIKVRKSGDDFILSVASDVLFGFDRADLSPDAQRSLTDVAAIIAPAPEGQVLVVGHTDAKGPPDYNLALSQRRAQSVAAFLETQGVKSERLRIEGRGASEPVAPNEINGKDNPNGRAENRRVEFVVPKSMLQN